MTEVDDETREQFQRIDGNFEQVGEQFRQVGEQFQQVGEQFRQVNDQFQRLFDFLDRRFSAIDARFDRLEEKVDRHRNEALANFDALYKRDEDRQMEYQAIKAALSRVESSVHRLEAADLENRVAKLEAAARGNHHDA